MLEEYVRAVSLGLYEAAIALDDRIKVAGAGCIALRARVHLTDTTRAMNESFVKATIARLVCVFVTEMPLAEDPGCVARGFEYLRDGRCLECHSITLQDGVRDPVFEGHPT